MSKINSAKTIGISLIVIAIIIVLIALIMNFNSGNTTGDLIVEGSGTMTGLKCTNDELVHPVFVDIQPSSHTNTITANFVDDELSTIMYRYDGVYLSEDEASDAKVMAEADYNLILANEYGEKIDIFTHTFMRDGNVVALTISGSADKITSKTAPYFLLDSLRDFPKNLDRMQAAYKAKGFSCTVENRK